MLTPYAIVRRCDTPSVFGDAHGVPLFGIDAVGLTLLCGCASKRRVHAEAFMDTVCVVHETHACVPMRFGDPLESERAGRCVLEAGADRFHRLLEQFDNADEWSIAVQPHRSSQLIEAKPPEAAQGGRSYLQRRRASLAIARGVRPDVSACLATLSAAFGPRVRDARTIAGEFGAGSLAVLSSRESDVVRMFRDITASAALPCTLTGPWPAFSFVGVL